MPLYFNIILIGIALLASLTAYFRHDSDIYLRLFPIFLLLSAIATSIGVWLNSQNKNNTSLYNLWSVVEFCFYFFCLYRIIRKTLAKKIVFAILCVYPIIAYSNIFLIQKLTIFHSMTFSLGCLLVVGIGIYYFLELFQISHSINLSRQPAFWICSGLLFFYACSFPIFGLANFLRSLPHVIRTNLGTIIDLLNVFLYSSFTIAFLCRLRTRKSMS